jgi:hypothetical protein
MTTIFVFGSNLAGRHGKGAALYARRHRGAIYGQGEGLQGTSYAIPTKDGRNGAKLTDPSQLLPLEVIAIHVGIFLGFADAHPELTFQVTPIGCGLAGYKPDDIAPLFAKAPTNCLLPPEFVEALLKRQGQW